MLYYLKLDAFFRNLYVFDYITIDDFKKYLKNKRIMLFIQLLPFFMPLLACIIGGAAYLLNFCDADSSLFIILMSTGLMIICLPAALTLGFICKSGRRMAEIRQVVLSPNYIQPEKAQLIMNILNSSNLDLNLKSLITTIVCVGFTVIALVSPFAINLADNISASRNKSLQKHLAQAELLKEANKESGNFDAALDKLREDFDDEKTYYYVFGEKDYLGEPTLIIVLARGSEESVYMTHFKVRDTSLYNLDYWVSSPDDLTNENIIEKADGIL